MNLLCEWCCESRKCECVAVPLPKPRYMLATRGTDTVSRPICNLPSDGPRIVIQHLESKMCLATGCNNQKALDPTGGMYNPGKSYEYCSRYCARTSGRLPEEQITDELCGGCSPAPECAVIDCYNTAWFDKRKYSFSLGCTRSHTEHAKSGQHMLPLSTIELSYSSCRAFASNTSVPVGQDVTVVQRVIQDPDQAFQSWCPDVDWSDDQVTG
jgi:hypothetical protein